MITVTAGESHEQVQSNSEEIILNGPPMHLTGNFTLENSTDEIIFIKELPLTAGKSFGSILSAAANFPINTALMPGEIRNHFAWFSLNPQTPPGTYEAVVAVGGNEKKVKMIVQENVELELSPSKVSFTGVAPGLVHKTEVLLVNRGNVPVTVPDIKHSTTLDFDFLCRSFSKAIRDKGNEGFMATMDEVTRDIQKDMAGWLQINIAECGQQVKGGTSLLLHFSITLPEKINVRNDYYGDIRLIDDLMLSYKIIPG